MTQFNELVDSNQEALAAFYTTLCTTSATMTAEEERTSRTFVDAPPYIYQNSLTVIALHVNERASQDVCPRHLPYCFAFVSPPSTATHV